MMVIQIRTGENNFNALGLFSTIFYSLSFNLQPEFFMMKKVYYLSSCSTCIRILKEANLNQNFELQDIKTNKITTQQIEQMQKLAGSYESLFSRRAIKYKSMGLKNQNLAEDDYKKLILEEYTFLKRPVVVIDNQIFIGNSAKTVAALKAITR